MRSSLTVTSLLALALGLTLSLATEAVAFHEEGVSNCDGCHTVHNSFEGTPVAGVGYQNLLLEANPSDLCLRCHGPDSNDIGVMSPDFLNPSKQGKGAGGGDFAFLREDNLNDGVGGATNPIPGERAGHNIVAPSRQVGVDTTNFTSPGGNYPSDKLTCTSCHNPHGGGQFRFLYGSNVKKGSTSNSLGYAFKFQRPVPIAEEISVYSAESNSNHSVYKSGLSDWCGSCHGKKIHDGHMGSGFEHPEEHDLETSERDNYNHYNGTLDPDNSTLADPYLALVPVEWNSSSNTINYTGPVDGSAKVTCLSCHRAHASSAPYSGRWDFNIETWADEGVASSSYAIENPYAASSGDQQRVLCEKCHGLDIPNHGGM